MGDDEAPRPLTTVPSNSFNSIHHNDRMLAQKLNGLWSIEPPDTVCFVMQSIGELASLKSLPGPVFPSCQCMSRKTVDRSQIQWSHQTSDAILHSTDRDDSIRTRKNCEQRRNDLCVILICFGHVLRRTKPLKAAVL
jgi:hypothetical protein